LTTSRGCDVGARREIELGDLRDRADDVVQLRAEPLQLVVSELEPGQVRHVKKLRAIDRHRSSF